MGIRGTSPIFSNLLSVTPSFLYAQFFTLVRDKLRVLALYLLVFFNTVQNVHYNFPYKV